MKAHRTYIKIGCIATGSLLTFATLKKTLNDRCELKTISSQIEKNSTKDTYELKPKDYNKYPWEQNYEEIEENSSDWEMRKIKIKGQMGKSRYYIPKEKEGKQGYLVYTGLTTGLHYVKRSTEEEIEKQIVNKKGIMINLGWVPVDKKEEGLKTGYLTVKDVIDEEEQEKHDIFEVYRDPYSGFVYQGMDPDDLEDEEKSFMEVENGKIIKREYVIEGVLRRGEKENVFLGKTNDEYNGKLGYANLNRMAGFYRFVNDDATFYYLDRVEDLKKKKKLVFPVPLDSGNLKENIEDMDFEGKKGVFGGVLSTLFLGIGLVI